MHRQGLVFRRQSYRAERIPEKTECCCNGNPMLRELSINLLLTIGSVWSLKIENVHSGPLELGLGLRSRG